MKKWPVILGSIAVLFLGTAYYYKAMLKNIIEKFEGLSLVPYKDTAGFWTIGYGHKIVKGDPYYPQGLINTITQEEADALLEQDTANAKAAVEYYVTVPINNAQKQALTSLVFNIGQNAFAGSTLLKLLNSGDYTGAANEFLKWNHAGGQIVAALTNRRADEQQLFLS